MRLANGVSATNWRRVKRSFCCVTPYACDFEPESLMREFENIG
jgi:hypothetical protein